MYALQNQSSTLKPAQIDKIIDAALAHPDTNDILTPEQIDKIINADEK